MSGFHRPGTRRAWLARLLPFLLLPLLAAWLLRQAPLAEIVQVLASIEPAALAVLIGFNLFAMLFFSSRWWIILRSLGQLLPYFAALRYRTAAFAIAYLTPGSQFGGEPLQVYALSSRHNLSSATATASVTLDKLFELLSNATFLAIGISVALGGRSVLDDSPLSRWFPLLLAALPLAYVLALAGGRAPLTGLSERLALRLRKTGQPVMRTARIDRFSGFIRQVESEANLFLCRRPAALLAAILAGGLIWALSLAEYWLSLYILGARLSLPQTIAALTAARLAFLTPLPGGLGALEAGQVLALEALGFSPAVGVAVSLWIRLRDLSIGLLGLWWGAGITRPVRTG